MVYAVFILERDEFCAYSLDHLRKFSLKHLYSGYINHSKHKWYTRARLGD